MTTHFHRRTWQARATTSLALMTVMLVVAAAFGGSARGDTASLIVLRPLAVVLAMIGIARLTRETTGRLAGPLMLLGAFAALILLHVVPLPPAVWSAMPGRDIVVEIDRAARLGSVWRSLTLDPWAGYNALFALSVPLAVLALGADLDQRGRQRMLATMIAIGLFSAVLGVFQFASGPNGPFYPYRISNNGSAIGLLANRNHQGVFLGTLFPLIAAYAAVVFGREARRRADGRFTGDARRWGAAIVAAMIVPVVFATSSRAGVAATAIGISGAMLVAWPFYREAAHRARHSPRSQHRRAVVGRPWFKAAMLGLGALGFVAFSIVAVGLAQGNAIDRLLAGDGAAPELRAPIWQATWNAVGAYFPVGSGAGSFVSAFQIHEPRALLTPLYVNHAHNDYLELLLEYGVLGPLLVAAAMLLVLSDGWTVWRADGTRASVSFARAASIALGQFAFGSLFDYPLRTPLLAAVAAGLVVLLRAGAHEARKGRVPA
jgi:O-antigen ligase